MLPSNGDGSARIKYLPGGNIEIVTGNTQRMLVSNGSVQVLTDLSCSGDMEFKGGLRRSYQFYHLDTGQASYAHMTASTVQLSGAAEVDARQITFLRVPMLKAGSVLGVSLYTETCTVKSGSLTGTILVNNSPTAAKVIVSTGTLASQQFSKDSYTFTAGQTLGVQLSCSAGYLTDTDPLSGSWMAVVDVEF